MDFMVAPDLRQRTIWKFNLITIACLSAWMTVVLWARRLVEELVRLPYVLRRRLTPVRVVVAIGVIGLVTVPTTLYFMEKGRHLDTRRAYEELTVSSTSESRYLRTALRGLLDEQSRLANLVIDSGNALYAGNKVYVKVSASGYSSSVAETDTTPFVTAANTATRLGVLAISRDLLSEYTPGAPFSFGDRAHISGLGDFLVEDVMSARWTNRIDVWFPTREQAVRFGLRDVVLSRTLDESNRVADEILSVNYSAELDSGGL